MSENPLEDPGLEIAPGDGSDDFDSDLGDARKAGHVAPIIEPK